MVSSERLQWLRGRPRVFWAQGLHALGHFFPPDIAVAERRAFEEARTNPPEGCSSGSEEETRASPTVSTHRGDSSFEAKCQCPFVEHGAGSDDDAALDLGHEASDGDSECDEPYSLDLDIVFDAMGLGKMVEIGCLCARFRRRLP